MLFEKKHIQKLLELSKQNIGTTTYDFGRVIEIPPTLSDEEYQIALIVENGGTLPNGKIVEGNYPTAKKDLQSKKDKNQKDILGECILLYNSLLNANDYHESFLCCHLYQYIPLLIFATHTAPYY